MALFAYSTLSVCGCWFTTSDQPRKQYLPQVQLDSHTTILANTSKTTLHQTFRNPFTFSIAEAAYTFPLYDGVSVGGFTCSVAGRVVVGVVKEKNQARADFDDAVSKGQTAGLLEQNRDAADAFTTVVGNVPAQEDVVVEITYFGELKNDAETDGVRFTIPTAIAPRYGPPSTNLSAAMSTVESKSMNITVDVEVGENCAIRGVQSPTHPIAVSMGTTSTRGLDASFKNNLGSATLTLGSTELDKDFVVVVSAEDQGTPKALLETHPTISNQRALMTTLVPKFNIPNESPEIVFLVDRSGSMNGNMHLVIDALKVFLKSLPLGVKFNICSFGSNHTFLFEKSKTYDADSLEQAMRHIDPRRFEADYGGTEILRPVQDVVKRRYKDLPLEVMLLTDGQIWNQEALFEIINEASLRDTRFFSLGIGAQASSSLVEGIARAGRGFSQWVLDGERIDKRIVRMLKGALSPHIKYKLEVKYAQESEEDDFEMVESSEKSMEVVVKQGVKQSDAARKAKPNKIISLFNPKAKDEPVKTSAGRYDFLPLMTPPNVLQTPHELPELYPHSRTTVYLMLGPDTNGRIPEAVVFRGTSRYGDLELEIPVQDIGQGDTIHKLATKKAVQELEEGRGWLTALRTAKGEPLKSENEGRWDLVVEREASRLGTTFQVAGKFCSFVAVEKVGDGDSPGSQRTAPAQAPPSPDLESRYSRPMATASAISFGMLGGQRSMPQQTALQVRSQPVARKKSAAPRSSTGGQPPRRQGFAMAASAAPPPPPSGVLSSFASTPAPPSGISNSYGSAPGGALFGSSVGMDSQSWFRHETKDERSVPSKSGSIAASESSGLEMMQRLISLQQFTGSWSVTDDFVAIISHNAENPSDLLDVKNVVMRGCTDQSSADRVSSMTLDACATVLAIAWLETVMKDESDVWEMVVEKARASLRSHADVGDRISRLVDGVRDVWTTGRK